MKMNITSRIFSGILALLFLVTTFSCSNLFESVEKESSKTSDEDTYVTLELSSSARTVLPSASTSDFTSLVLKGTKSGEEESELGSWESVSSMQNATVAVSTGTWSFTLTAKDGGSTFSGTCSKEITAGENPLSFELSLSNIGTGSGSFNISLSFAGAENADKISFATASLEDLNGTNVSGFESQKLIPSENTVTFSSGENNVKAGTYRAKVTFYATSEKDGDFALATYRELVQISSDLTSSASRTITSFDELYSVTYNFNGGDLASGKTAAETFTRKTETITLPDATRDYYEFSGWFTDENFSDASKITQIAQGTTEKVTLYAKWTPITYTITYDLNDSKKVSDGIKSGSLIKSYTVEDAITLVDPSPDYYILDAFYEDSGFSKKIAGWSAGDKHGDITIYAKWNGIKATAENIAQRIKDMQESDTIVATGDFNTDTISGVNSALKTLSSDVKVTLDLSNVTGLTELTAAISGENVTESASFYGCTNLRKIMLPSTITYIGEGAFSGCSGLEEMTLPFVGSKEPTNVDISTNENAFSYIFGTKEYTGGTKVTQVGVASGSSIKYSGYIPSSLKKITLTTTKIIPMYAFNDADCNFKCITSITIPKSVIVIDKYAFSSFRGMSLLTNAIFETPSGWYKESDLIVGTDGVPDVSDDDLIPESDLADASKAAELLCGRWYLVRKESLK